MTPRLADWRTTNRRRGPPNEPKKDRRTRLTKSLCTGLQIALATLASCMLKGRRETSRRYVRERGSVQLSETAP